MNRPAINPALGLDLVPERTLSRADATVTVLIPAHNEQDTVCGELDQLAGLPLGRPSHRRSAPATLRLSSARERVLS